MLSRIFPKQFDNSYRGYQLAIWFLVLFLIGKALASLNAMGVNPFWTSRDTLQGVEGVRLDAFGSSAADAALALYGWWGVTHLMLTLLAFAALVRYRAMIPLILLLAAIEKIGMQVIAEVSPTRLLGAGAPMPIVAIVLLLIGFGLSVTTPQRRSVEMAEN